MYVSVLLVVMTVSLVFCFEWLFCILLDGVAALMCMNVHTWHYCYVFILHVIVTNEP